MSFKDEEIARLAASGWARCASVAAAVRAAGLPAISHVYLEQAFGDDLWARAEHAVRALREHFASARFADETDYGLLLVPDPHNLDTRRPVPPGTRRDQLGTPTADVFDDRLPAGVLGVRGGAPWTPVATVIGRYGPSLGSHNEIVNAPAEEFTVAGADTRTLMIRQLWGARLLQCGSELPDSEVNARWTFTLFPGEGLIAGMAESGTVLRGKVRFRLGRPDRKIGSARVAPALAL
ncbi:hypothetical protein [Nonomuraea jiangxiensis]|uniref:Uncharacterized protein n=1 Tax=Nonomuraea jiangxiensis TaxID=633440 RepID=A0A1G8W5D8_9ACTN|nr:hypothetical protein [Nonomuraea jiangxiensis]SDJ72720.1 hypothetical protein SAMN05421869_11234 [Nonomuraea jiangxiensis]